MNIFSFRDRLIADYAEYVKSFMRFDREDLREFVEEAREEESGAARFVAREAHDRSSIAGQKPGFLCISADKPWPKDSEREALLNRLPADWVDESGRPRRIGGKPP